MARSRKMKVKLKAVSMNRKNQAEPSHVSKPRAYLHVSPFVTYQPTSYAAQWPLKKTNNLMVRSMLYINGDLLGFHEVIPVTKKL